MLINSLKHHSESVGQPWRLGCCECEKSRVQPSTFWTHLGGFVVALGRKGSHTIEHCGEPGNERNQGMYHGEIVPF